MIEFKFGTNLIVVVGYGRLGLPDIDLAATRAAHHPLLRDDADSLINLRDVERLELDQSDLTEIVRHEEYFSRKLKLPRRIAVVATNDYNFGISRMYQALSLEAVSEVRVFWDLFLARAWLDGPRDPDWQARRLDAPPPHRL